MIREVIVKHKHKLATPLQDTKKQTTLHAPASDTRDSHGFEKYSHLLPAVLPVDVGVHKPSIKRAADSVTGGERGGRREMEKQGDDSMTNKWCKRRVRREGREMRAGRRGCAECR